LALFLPILRLLYLIKHEIGRLRTIARFSRRSIVKALSQSLIPLLFPTSCTQFE
jgi:hypothetical protein